MRWITLLLTFILPWAIIGPQTLAAQTANVVAYEADSGWQDWILLDGWTMADGQLLYCCSLSIYGPNRLIAPYIPDSPDYAVEAEVQWRRASSVGALLVARGYLIGADTGNGSRLLILAAPAEKDSHQGSNDWWIPFNPGTSWHTYRAELRGDRISVFVDGSMLMSIGDNIFRSAGSVGIVAGGDIAVRSFRVLLFDSVT